MKDRNLEAGTCIHEPKIVIGVPTVMTIITCKKCGRKYFYKNRKALLAITIILYVLLSAAFVFLLMVLKNHLDNLLYWIIGIILMLVYWFLFDWIARMIYKRFGKTVTIP